jgi:hypothetical protein
MPGFDRTGPRGQGPMTGWGIGPCGGGRAYGFGRGGGRGRGGRGRGLGPGPVWGAGQTYAGDEVTVLREQSEQLKERLEEIEERLAALSGNDQASAKKENL